MLRKCRNCGKVFELTYYNRSYCSEECRNAYYGLKYPIYKKKCAVCGKEFETKNKAKEYCSMECRHKATALVKKHSPLISFDKICAHCGKEFVTGTRKKRFCSEECQRAYNKKKRKAKPKKSHSLEEKVEAAARLGISYGMYCAIMAGHIKPPKGLLLNDI